MKLKYIKSIVAVSLLAIVSCDVERFPFDAIESGQSFGSVSDAGNWSNTLIPK